MQYLRHRTARWIFILAAAALLPLIVFAASNAVSSLRHERAALEQDALDRTRQLSDLVDLTLTAQLELLRALTALEIFDGEPDYAAVERMLRRVQQNEPLWLTAQLARPDGNYVVHLTLPSPGTVRDPASLNEVVAAGAPSIGNIVVGSTGSGIAIRAPVIRDGIVRYVLTAIIQSDSVNALLAGADLPSAWLVAVIDGSGRIVARNLNPVESAAQPASAPALAARASGRQGGLYESVTREGRESVSAYWLSPRTNWSVHIAMPRAEFNAPLIRSAWLIAGEGVAAIVVFLMFTLLLLREIRARRAEREALELAQRTVALGRLSGTVAHDFNNLLTVVLGNVQILERRQLDGDAVKRIAQIKRAATHGAQLTNRLLSLTRSETGQVAVIDLNANIRSIHSMLRQAVGTAVAVELELSADLPPVSVDPLQLELMLLNLAANARDAMPDGGFFRVTTRIQGDLIALAASDTGAGIPPEILPHVFEPFFTTKSAAKGSGLGLAQVQSFAQRSGGSATITSKTGAGTTVTILLPAQRHAAIESAAPAPDTPATPVGRRRQALLVDDDPMVREVTAEYLDDLGFSVRQVADAAEAIGVLEREAVDLVVSDILMPGELDGVGLARRIRARWPDTRVVLISGYSAAADAIRDERHIMVRKPFTSGDLETAIDRAIAEKAAAV